MSNKYRNNGYQLNRTAEDDFQERHITIIWQELKERFGFNVKAWKQRFEDYFDKQPRTVSKAEAFYKFGSAEINMILNRILCRNDSYPTFKRFIEYVVKKL